MTSRLAKRSCSARLGAVFNSRSLSATRSRKYSSSSSGDLNFSDARSAPWRNARSISVRTGGMEKLYHHVVKLPHSIFELFFLNKLVPFVLGNILQPFYASS